MAAAYGQISDGASDHAATISPGCRNTFPPPSALQEGVAVVSNSPAEALWGGAFPLPPPRSNLTSLALNVFGGSMGEPSPPCCLFGVQATTGATVATTLVGAVGAKIVPEAEATEEVVVAVSKRAALLSALVDARETS